MNVNKDEVGVKKDEKFEKNFYVVVFGIVVFFILLFLAYKAGANIGNDLGKFIYYVTH